MIAQTLIITQTMMAKLKDYGQRLAHCQRGEGLLTLPILILITVMVLYMGVDILGFYAANQKLRLATGETLNLMKIENGWDEGTETFFQEMLIKTGLAPDTIRVISATPKNQSPPVQRGEPVVLEVSTTYEARSLKPLNRTITVPVVVKMSGLAQEFHR
jgi:hypothetical protein